MPSMLNTRIFMIQRLALATLFCAVAMWSGIATSGVARAQPADKMHFSKKGTFSDVFQDLKDAVINRGLVIDYTGHVDKMLERTAKSAGSVTESGDKSPYLHAKYVQFCSAKLTHESVSANPYNLAICPYIVFIFETKAEPGKIVVGYRKPQPGPSRLSKKAFAKVTKLLAEISKEVTSE